MLNLLWFTFFFIKPESMHKINLCSCEKPFNQKEAAAQEYIVWQPPTKLLYSQ